MIVLEHGVEVLHWSEADPEISRIYRLLLRDNPDPTIPPATIALSVLQAGQVQDDRVEWHSSALCSSLAHSTRS